MSDPVGEARALLQQESQRIRDALRTERSRRRAPMVRRLHEIRRMLDPGYRYASQAGQDLLIDMMMGQKRGGTFLDIGGYDGVTGSNTFFFEVFRGWTGVLVEPVPDQLEKAQQVRRCTCIACAVAPTRGEADFIEVTSGYTQMSGLADSYDETMLSTVRENSQHRERVLKVETRTLPDIMSEAGLESPDFVSLDIEGGELDVLQSYPFQSHSVRFWSIENNSGDGRIADIMRSNGYELAEFCGPDEIYKRVE